MSEKLDLKELKGKRILAVGAHPDDVEFMCAGTLLILASLGFELHVATLTQGDGGSLRQGPQEIARIRRAEAERACELMGARYHYVGFTDFGIYNTDYSNRRMTAVFREVDPWVVFTHPPVDYLSDHEITSRLVRNACFYGPVPNYDTSSFGKAGRTSTIPYLFYSQPLEGIDLLGNPVKPHFYVDVSSVFPQKEKLLACHASQREWLRSHHGMDEYLESLRRWSQLQGTASASSFGRPVEYAEAFTQHRGHAYPAEKVLNALLPELVAEIPPSSSDR